jgi:predicted  nucleic acid-binding Zn-ribbon protein
MHQNPFSAGGYDYSSLERQLHQKADSHELHSLRSDVARLERTNGELSSRIDDLRSRCERIEEELGLERQERATAADAINAIRDDLAKISVASL